MTADLHTLKLAPQRERHLSDASHDIRAAITRLEMAAASASTLDQLCLSTAKLKLENALHAIEHVQERI